jgi:hypothetical protein
MDSFVFTADSFRPSCLKTDAKLPELMSLGELRVDDDVLPAVCPILWRESVSFRYKSACRNTAAEVANNWSSQILLQAWGRVRVFIYNPSIHTEFPALEAASQIHDLAGFPSPITFLRSKSELEVSILGWKKEVANRKSRLALDAPKNWKNISVDDPAADYCILILSDLEQHYSTRFNSDLLDLIGNGPRFGFLCWNLVCTESSVSNHHEYLRSQQWIMQLLDASSCIFEVTDTKICISGDSIKMQPFATFEEFGGIHHAKVRQQDHSSFCERIEKLLLHEKEEAKADFLDIRIGKRNGQEFNLRLGPGSEVYHGMLAGGTGSGKTVFLKHIIVSACEKYSPKQLKFHIFDFKDGVDLACFSGIEHIAHLHTNCSQPSAVIEALVDFVSEAQQRNKAFITAQSEGYAGGDLYDYNKWAEANGKDIFAYQVLMIDETARLFMMVKGDYDLQRKLIDLLMQVAMVGRSPGLSLLLASQSFSEMPSQVDGLRGHMKLRMSLQLSRPSDCYGIFAPGNNAAFYELKSTKQSREILVNYENGKSDGNQMVKLDKMDHSTLLPRISDLRLKWPATQSRENAAIRETHSFQEKVEKMPSQGGDTQNLLRKVNNWFPESSLPDFPK